MFLSSPHAKLHAESAVVATSCLCSAFSFSTPQKMNVRFQEYARLPRKMAKISKCPSTESVLAVAGVVYMVELVCRVPMAGALFVLP